MSQWLLPRYLREGLLHVFVSPHDADIFCDVKTELGNQVSCENYDYLDVDTDE